MPTTNPRLMVVISRDQDKLLEELGRLQGRSKASYLREMLDAAEPMLGSLAKQMRAFVATVEGQPLAVRDIVMKTFSDAFGDEGQPLLEALVDAAEKMEAADEAKTPDRSGARTGRSPARRLSAPRSSKRKSAR